MVRKNLDQGLDAKRTLVEDRGDRKWIWNGKRTRNLSGSQSLGLRSWPRVLEDLVRL